MNYIFPPRISSLKVWDPFNVTNKLFLKSNRAKWFHWASKYPFGNENEHDALCQKVIWDMAKAPALAVILNLTLKPSP